MQRRKFGPTALMLIVTLAATLACAVSASPQDSGAAAKIDFYGKKVSVLKFFGQKRWGDCMPGAVDGTRINHAAGVLVDRSLTPNAVYVADSGNSRILGFRSYDSKKADLIFGQPDEFSSAPNGDSNLGRFGKPGRTSLCLMDIPGNTNLAEQSLRLNFDVDAEGNLYFPDHGNNRVLMYRAPFSADKSDGKGDTIPDLVLGQANYESNGINRGRGPGKCDVRSLFLSYGNAHGFDHVASRGVSVDARGNIWVADTFNCRVLRFPKGATAADLVLGQPNFTQSAPAPDLQAALDRMCTPTLARVNPDTGELYVVDEYPGGFPARILVFKPPFKNGMKATRMLAPKQRLAGDYAQGYRFSHCTGLVFNPVKTDHWIDEEKKTHRYRDGVLWIHEGEGQQGPRTLLLDKEGTILLALAGPDDVTYGGRYYNYEKAGMKHSEDFNLAWPGGMIGFDADHNIYLADEEFWRIARYALPYRARRSGEKLILPPTNGGMIASSERRKRINPAHVAADQYGLLVIGNQLVVRDAHRLMVWNDYLAKPSGAPADLFPGQDDGWTHKHDTTIYEMAAIAQGIDHRNRLWMIGGPMLTVYPLPLRQDTKPLRTHIPLYWKDQPDQRVSEDLGRAMAFEPATNRLWAYDLWHHRLLRVEIPEDITEKFFVDAVIGQENKTENRVNRGMAQPDAASLGDVGEIKFDRLGNLFVVDNEYEYHPNGRILMFTAADMKSINTMFPAIEAKKVYVAARFDQLTHARTFLSTEYPLSPVSVAFNSRNEMVVGCDGYYRGDPAKRNVNQLYLYRKPLEKPTPDAVIELPLGSAGEITFDAQDNLIVQDHTYNKVWVINYDRDPVWLRALK